MRAAIAILVVATVSCKGGGERKAPDRTWIAGLPAAAPVVRCADEGACREACEGGDGAACARQAAWARIERGELVVAAEVLGRACERGALEACVEQAVLDFNHLDAARDPARGLARMQRACDAGARRACDLLADTYAVGGEIGPADRPRAMALLERVIELARAACVAGAGDECAALANALLKVKFLGGGGAGQDEVHRLLQRACTLGSAGGCAGSATPYLNGGDDDRAAARALLDRACAIDPAECAAGALAASEGLTGAKDPARATELYRRACDAWSAAACSWLAATDAAGRATWAERACRIQPTPSCAAAPAP